MTWHQWQALYPDREPARHAAGPARRPQQTTATSAPAGGRAGAGRAMSPRPDGCSPRHLMRGAPPARAWRPASSALARAILATRPRGYPPSAAQLAWKPQTTTVHSRATCSSIPAASQTTSTRRRTPTGRPSRCRAWPPGCAASGAARRLDARPSAAGSMASHGRGPRRGTFWSCRSTWSRVASQFGSLVSSPTRPATRATNRRGRSVRVVSRARFRCGEVAEPADRRRSGDVAAAPGRRR